jgi:PEP-CTERM motif-containing protein
MGPYRKSWMKISILIYFAGALSFLVAVPAANATVVTVDYTGTVTFAGSLGGTVPTGIAIGAEVTGRFSYDTALAAAPITSSGSYTTQSFGFATGLSETVTIGGNIFSKTGGEIFLQEGFIFGNESKGIGINSNPPNVPGSFLSLEFFDDRPPLNLFTDINSLDSVTSFANTTSNGLGFIYSGNGGFFVNYTLDPLAVSEPTSMVLFGVGLTATGVVRRRWRL